MKGASGMHPMHPRGMEPAGRRLPGQRAGRLAHCSTNGLVLGGFLAQAPPTLLRTIRGLRELSERSLVWECGKGLSSSAFSSAATPGAA